MKKILLVTAMVLFGFGSMAAAQSVGTFPITATIPSATTVAFIVSQVTPGAVPVFTPQAGLNLNFNTAGSGMQYDAVNGIWVGSRFFAIDLSPRDAANNPAPANYGSITFAYGSNVVPAGQPSTKGLNVKATLTAVRVEGATGSQTETPVITSRNIGGTLPSLTNADVTGGFLRVYVGLATGEEVGGFPVAPGSEPFTNGDKPGTYTGTLTITATLI